MVFKKEKGSGLGYQELRDANGRSAIVLCATRPASVQTLEWLFDLPAGLWAKGTGDRSARERALTTNQTTG